MDEWQPWAVGWTAWSWSDWPLLLANHRAGDFTPTPFGAVVKAGLGKAGPPVTTPSAAET